MRRFFKRMASVVLMCSMLAMATGAVFAAAPQKTLQGNSYKHLKAYLEKYDKSKFSKVVDLGDLTKYREALVNVKIVINPKLKAMAMYDPKNNTMYLSADPAKVPASKSLSMGNTIWHELTHKIEYMHNDYKLIDSKDYGERNIEYMTHIADAALVILERMEADKSSDPAKTQKYWTMFEKAVSDASKLPEVKKYPADLKLMKTWFGFTADVAAIDKFYESGGAGAYLKKALSAGVSWDGAWSTNFGVLTIRQSGSSVSGTYSYDSGSMKGTVSGNTLTGTWSEIDDSGTFSFTMSSDGKAFSGSWKEVKPDPGQGGSWNGTKK